MTPDKLPTRLPAGTWIRMAGGPMGTYAESHLRQGSDGPYYEGGSGSAYLKFGPERVHWEALESADFAAHIHKVCLEYARLGIDWSRPR